MNINRSKPTELRWTRTSTADQRPIVGDLQHLTSRRVLEFGLTLDQVTQRYPGETIAVDYMPWPS